MRKIWGGDGQSEVNSHPATAGESRGLLPRELNCSGDRLQYNPRERTEQINNMTYTKPLPGIGERFEVKEGLRLRV